jgi:hypothetical protein
MLPSEFTQFMAFGKIIYVTAAHDSRQFRKGRHSAPNYSIRRFTASI